MTLLKDRLQSAGANTADARLVVMAVDALREAEGSLPSAINILWKNLINESWVAREVWLRPYLVDRLKDMRGPISEEEPKETARPKTPNVQTKVSPERKAAIDSLINKAVAVIQFKYRTSDGRDWARVGAHELAGMDRDGTLAREIRSALGQLSNSQATKELGELMSPSVFNDIRARLVSPKE